ncbi:MAG TPA: tripartite tricarboxylate transporter permease [Candidatus Bilamarchaeum sp.]|nr:tripartite tricarboxylate transporter permease [Candidatus Bilamarchaeum sp.]
MLGEIALGLLLGGACGLIPGIHPNLVASLAGSVGWDAGALSIVLASMYSASIVFSFVPSVFFGIPEDASVACALAGQRMALGGKGISALKTMAASAALSALIAAGAFGASLAIYPAIYTVIGGFVKYILLALSAALILRGRNPALSLAVFASAGILGKLTLDSAIGDPFLPLFSGMFALSSILGSGGRALPAQEDGPLWGGFPAYSALGAALGLLSNLLPAIGSSAQIAALASIFVPLGSLQYLATISSISASQALFSLASAVSIGKSRNGVTAWIAENTDISGSLGPLSAAFLAGAIVAALIVYLCRTRIAALAGNGPQGFGKIIAAYIFAVTFVIDGIPGVAVLGAAAMLGTAAIRLGAGRISLMGAIIVPTLVLLF